jgi:hypothetical protein
MIDTQLTALRDRRKSLETSSSVHANAVKEHRHKRSIELQKRLSDIVNDNENANNNGIDSTTSRSRGEGTSPKGSTRDITVPVGDTCKGTTSKRLKLCSVNDNDSSNE